MRFAALLSVLALASVAAGQQPVPAPPLPAPPKNTDIIEVQRAKAMAPWTEFAISRGSTLLMDSQSPASKWLLIDDSDADLLLVDGGQRAAFICAKAGVYRLAVLQAGELKRVRVTVADPAPPKPPIPIVPPKPAPPKPADPLADKLKAAFDADVTANKREAVKDLAALYRQCAKLANKKTVTTAEDLMTQVHAAATDLLGDADALKGLRAVANAELQLGVPINGPLTDAQRVAMSSLFLKLATILEGF